jgi:hypothetical protein
MNRPWPDEPWLYGTIPMALREPLGPRQPPGIDLVVQG